MSTKQSTRASGNRLYRVGTFCHTGGRGRPVITAYLRDYNPQWDGCREYTVSGPDGTTAKKLAVDLRHDWELRRKWERTINEA